MDHHPRQVSSPTDPELSTTIGIRVPFETNVFSTREVVGGRLQEFGGDFVDARCPSLVGHDSTV